MDNWFILISTLALLSIRGSNCQDLSNFYLPPCCYAQEPFMDFASSRRSSSSSKRAIIGSLKNVNLPESTSETDNDTATSSSNQRKPAYGKNKETIYEIFVPLVEDSDAITDNILPKSNIMILTTERPTRKVHRKPLKPPATSRILFPEKFKNTSIDKSETKKFKRESRQTREKTKLLEEVLGLELEAQENQRSFVAKKALRNERYLSSVLPPEHRSIYDQWESHKLFNRNKKFLHSDNHRKDKLLVESQSGNVIKRQVIKAMPVSWLKNLRKALYQSITAANKIPNYDLSHDSNARDFPARHPEVWNSLQNTMAQFIDRKTRASIQLPETIYLPNGSGPVVAGVLVNSNQGQLMIRMTSDLYMGPQKTAPNSCNCFLINQGEIPIAYWSVSRTTKPDGQPALQYLVYPLPFNVPTPPSMMPFSGQWNMFRPSFSDPFSGNYGYQQRPNSLDFNQQIPEGVIREKLDQNVMNHPFRERNPKYYGEFINGNGHPRPEIHENQIPPPPPLEVGPPLGFITEQNGQYTPEFLNMYQGVVQNQFQGTGPGPQFPISAGFTNGVPFPTGFGNQFENAGPSGLPPISMELVTVPLPLVQEISPVPPLDPTTFPVNQDQLQKPPTFPKSIQDIIAPFPPSGGGSGNGDQELGPSLENIPLDFPLPENLLSTPVTNNNPQQQFTNPQRPINQVNNPEQMDQGVFLKPLPDPTVRPKGSNQYQNTDKAHDDRRPMYGNGDHHHRPYKVSNLLDNEKKYYPRRKPYDSYETDRKFLNTRRPYISQKLDNPGGYILDF